MLSSKVLANRGARGEEKTQRLRLSVRSGAGGSETEDTSEFSVGAGS